MSINEVRREQWDEMAHDNVLASYGWLKTVEETSTENVNTKYILVQDSDKLVGAAVCRVSHRTASTFNLDDCMFGRVKRYAGKLGISFLPALICCPPKSYGTHFLVERDADLDRMENIMSELLETIEKEASEHRISVVFDNVMDNEVHLIDLLHEKGYSRTLNFPLNYMDIEWSSFDGYRRHVKRIGRMKKVINREINKNRKEGVLITQLEDISGHEDRLYKLINNNYLEHNGIPFPFKRHFLRKLKLNLGNNAILYVSAKKNNVTGVSVLLERNKVGYIPFVGVDHELAGNDFTYFNIAYYRPIADAISNRLRRLYFGTAMYELKMRRGCKITDTYVFCKPYNRIMKTSIKPWFLFHSLWYKHKIPKKVRNRGRPSNNGNSSRDNGGRNGN